MPKIEFLDKTYYLDIFSKIFTQETFFACWQEATLVTASRNHEIKFLDAWKHFREDKKLKNSNLKNGF